MTATSQQQRRRGSKLDAREREIRRLLSLGWSQRWIAARLGCHEVTLSLWLKRKRGQWLRGRANFGLTGEYKD